MNRIAVICPTKGRLEQAIRAYESMVATSTLADMVWCVDEVDREVYLPESNRERLRLMSFPIYDPAPRVNAAVACVPEYEVYGMMTDDAEFTTPGWDLWVLDRYAEFPGRIGVVSPFHNAGPWCNFPYISREWFNVVGWFACPDTRFYCWDGVLEILGESTHIAHAQEHEFGIQHHLMYSDWQAQSLVTDGAKFLAWHQYGRRTDTQKLRAAISAAQ